MAGTHPPGGSAALGLAAFVLGSAAWVRKQVGKSFDDTIRAHATRMLEEGKRTFRYDTFGNEAFWGDALRLHRAIAGGRNGGVGTVVSPKTALAVGLKVDADALPEALKQQLRAGKVDLDDPATTLALLKLNAAVGVTGLFDGPGKIRSIGIHPALRSSS